MPKRYTQRIIRLLTRAEYQPLKQHPLAQALVVPDDEYEQFAQALEHLRQEGRIVIGSQGAICLPDFAGRVTGTYLASSKGFGFLRPDKPTAQGDLFIPTGESLDAVTGDKVEARVIRRGRRAGQIRLTGRIIEVLSRGETRFTGTLLREDRQWFVQPDGKALREWIAVDDPGAKNARAGDKVLVEILNFPQPEYYANGVIIERLGKSGTSSAELKGIIRRYRFEDKFSRSALHEIRQAVRGFDAEKEIRQGEREDIRGQQTITIDPADARDFDDAISLKHLGQGRWQLGVHIADVSHFVPTGSHLDQESRQRGTSVYLPGQVIPMLPELLSNGICSLQEGQDRLVKSIYIKLDDNGRVLGRRFANSVMRSRRRLTYEDVDQILAGTKNGFDKRTVTLIQKTAELGHILQKRRVGQGMLRLELPKAELVYNDKGEVIDARPESTTFSHTIIEMFMLEANEAVAELLDSIKVPFLRRVHAEPDNLAGGDTARVIKLCGYTIPKKIDRAGIQKLLAAVEGKPESFIINLMVLKSMQKAEYSPAPIGHYALASRHYCHFTSPIRRYPDLAVHRLLQAQLEGRLIQKTVEEFPCYDEMEELGAHCSNRERIAEQAEDDLRNIKILQMLAGHVGEDGLGVVTSITKFGLFVQLEKFLIEGLIRAEDVWRGKFSSRRGGKKRKAAKGSQTGGHGRRGSFIENCPFKMGQEIRVRIAGVNVAAQTLDLVPSPNDK